MDDLIDEILPELPDSTPQTQFIYHVPFPIQLPADESWVQILNNAKDEFEAHDIIAVFSTWRDEVEDSLDVGDAETADGIHAQVGRMVFDASMTDARAARLLVAIKEGDFILKIKYLNGRKENNWTLLDKLDPVKTQRDRSCR